MVHVFAPIPSEKEDLGHNWHPFAWASAEEYLPGGHNTGADAPVVVNVPGGESKHSANPLWEYFPGGQGRQLCRDFPVL